MLLGTMKTFKIIALLFAICSGAWAQSPEQVALVVNSSSEDSLALANHYIGLRKIPLKNVIYLDLPEDWEGTHKIGHADYKKRIETPVSEQLKARGLDDQVKAWIYSAGFPYRMNFKHGWMSLTGATFLRGHALPVAKELKMGTFRSPCFSGPNPPEDGSVKNSVTVDRFGSDASGWRPTPAMMLSYTGTNGLNLAQSKQVLDRGLYSDGTMPMGTFYMTTNSNIRSKARAWQFPPTVQTLKSRRLKAQIDSEIKGKRPDIAGFMTGTAHFNAPLSGVFLPGAFAENLTSFGATFSTPDQTKCTEWLKAGATATAGTVVEPYAQWPKFPSAFIFMHQTAGCTALESIYQSVRCPLQLLPLGEPLSRPWMRKGKLLVVMLDDGAIKGETSIHASLRVPDKRMRGQISYFIDGKAAPELGTGSMITFDSRQLTDGWHRVRALATVPFAIRWNASDTHDFEVTNRGRSCTVSKPAPKAKIEHDGTLSVSGSATKGVQRFQLRANGRVISEQKAVGEGFACTVLAAKLGQGAIELQLEAVFEKDYIVKSKPLKIRIKAPVEPK